MAALKVVAVYDLLDRAWDYGNEARGLQPVSIAAKILYYRRRYRLLFECTKRSGRVPTRVFRWCSDGSPDTEDYGRPRS